MGWEREIARNETQGRNGCTDGWLTFSLVPNSTLRGTNNALVGRRELRLLLRDANMNRTTRGTIRVSEGRPQAAWN